MPHKHRHIDKKHRNRHSQVSKHSRPSKHKHDSSVRDQFRSKLRFIESLRGRYAGREIWVFATGPSLDDIPEDFLKVDEIIPPDKSGKTVPKISIAVKEAAMPFPDCTYNIWAFRDRALRRMYFPRGQIPRKFGKFIFTIRPQDKDNYYGKQSLKATFLRYTKGGTIGKMRVMCKSIIANNSSIYYGVGTITHLAIAAALVMGASKISLVGCDHGSIDGKLRFQRGITRGYGWKYSNMRPYKFMKIGTNFLADYFKDHGVEIVRYYHGEGYRRISSD